MVSQATFPTYFLGEDKDQIKKIQTELDAHVFGSKIASELGITLRILGRSHTTKSQLSTMNRLKEY